MFGIDAILLVIAIPLLLIFVTAKQNRRHVASGQRNRCRSCDAAFEPHAKFCGHCGRPL